MKKQDCYRHPQSPAYAIVVNSTGGKLPVCILCLAEYMKAGYAVEEVMPLIEDEELLAELEAIAERGR